MVKKKIYNVLLIGLLFHFLVGISYGQVKAWEGTIVIPTYSWEDDVNPKFWAMEEGPKNAGTITNSIIYPYTMQDHLTMELENVTYKALFLENEYLKIICLPEYGGRFHSVHNKITNQEVFDMNEVIKPALIGMRGAFISGGVEWNAGPQVHTVTAVSPVDALIGSNEDGSAYIEVSNLEKSLRTKWTVRVTLHPGKAYMKEKVRIYNPTDAMNPYYYWRCTAFPETPGSRFIYPMSLGTDHYGIQFFKWPIHNGVDMTWTKNYEYGTAIFSVNCDYDFFGAYDAELDRGVVQVGKQGGKKAWTWGQGGYGYVNQMNLTDDPKGFYIEVQSGPLPTQSDYGILTPRSEISWDEYWFPVYGLGDGFEYANEKVSFQTYRKNNSLEIRIIATQKYPGARCKLVSGNKVLQEKQVDLSPADVTVLSLERLPKGPVIIDLKTKDGEAIAGFETPLPIPEVTPPDLPTYYDKSDDELTVQEIYLKAQKFDRSMDRLKARKYYNMALAFDSLHLLSLRDLAILDFESGLYEKAAKSLAQSLVQIPNDDGVAWYFLGLCNLKQNNINNALRCGLKTARCLGTVSLGNDLIARCYMLQEDYPKAIEYYQKAVFSDQNNHKTYHQYLLALYASGQRNLAEQLAVQYINNYPTELVPRALAAIIQGNLPGFASKAREFVGEYDFELLETSLTISEVGLIEEAISILESACATTDPEDKQNMLLLYHIAYLNDIAGNDKKAMDYLSQAAKSYSDFIFASHPETEEVLKFAIRKNSGDALAYYQLGNLYGNFGRLDEAAELWNKTVSLNPSLSIAWRNLGLYYWEAEQDLDKSEKCYRNAIKARPDDQTLYRDMGRVLVENHKRPEAIELLEKVPYKNKLRSDIILDLAEFYLDENRYDECLKLLKSVPYFIIWEGSTISWNLYNQANLRKGTAYFNEKNYEAALDCFVDALSFPENLGIGKSKHTEEAEAWFWRGKTLGALGKSLEALEAWKMGSESHLGSEKQNRYRKMCSELLH